MYLSDGYLVYANGVDAACYNNLADCYRNINSGKYGMPTTGWIYNSNILQGQSEIYENWLLSPHSDILVRAFSMRTFGNIDHNGEYCGYGKGVRPVLYLSSNVKITDGTGEQNNPYKLGL